MIAVNRNAGSLASLLVLLTVADTVLFRTGGRSRLVWGGVAYAGLGAVYRYAGLQLDEVGLSPSKLQHNLVPSAQVSAGCVLLLVAANIAKRGLFDDARYQYPLPTAIVVSVGAVPFKTVIFEELAFRGMLPALLARTGVWRYALTITSLLFGVWHIPTAGGTAVGFRRSYVSRSRRKAVLAVVAVTTIAGWLFSWLRRRSGSLLMPAAAHWTVNSTAIMLTAFNYWTRDAATRRTLS